MDNFKILVTDSHMIEFIVYKLNREGYIWSGFYYNNLNTSSNSLINDSYTLLSLFDKLYIVVKTFKVFNSDYKGLFNYTIKVIDYNISYSFVEWLEIMDCVGEYEAFKLGLM